MLLGPTVRPSCNLTDFNTIQLSTTTSRSVVDDYDLIDSYSSTNFVDNVFVHAPKRGIFVSNRDDKLTNWSSSVIRSIYRSDNIKGVVVHHGTNGTIMMDKFFDTIDKPEKLILENSAGQGKSMGYNIDEIRKSIEKYNCRLCIDTQHSYASGMVDFSSWRKSKKFIINLIDDNMNLSLVHINDSCCQLGQRIDRHANIGEGNIWGGKIRRAKRLVKLLTSYDICSVVETKDPINDCIKMM